ncbi:MAG: cytochrome c [Anaerolineales bacterium]|nr:cytochrome c [Anaerolineales bacterium]
MLRGLDDVQLIGPLRLDEVITTHIEQEQPDIVLVARQEGEFADISSLTSQLLDGHPGLPVIHCTLSANSVRIYTSRDLPARTSELVQAIRELPIHRDLTTSGLIYLPGRISEMDTTKTKFVFKSGLAILSVILGSFLLLISVYLVQASPPPQSDSEGQTIFTEKCQSCHTLGGGDTVGPDLAGVTSRRDREWLISFIVSPEEMIQEGDPTANQLLEIFNNLIMPDMGLSELEAEAVLAYIENQSGEVSSAEVGQSTSQQGSVDRGRLLYNGGIPLKNGGTPCLACHSMGDFGALGGGNFGPDLTRVYSRYGEESLNSVLGTLPFPTMKPLFADRELTDQERSDLAAYFQWADTNTKPTKATRGTLGMWIGGSLGVVVLFGIMLIFWPRQRTSISERLRRKQ